MANVKISELTALTTPAVQDKLVIVDDSEGSAEKTKYITWANLLNSATEIRLSIGGTAQIILEDGVLYSNIDNDIDLGKATNQFKDLYLEGGITINAIAQGKDVTAALHRKIVNIGDWNMDSTSFVNVAHGLTLSKIRSVEVLILRDDSAVIHKFGAPNGGAARIDWYQITATNVELVREASGYFDGTNWDSTSFNRGWVVIQYVD